MANIKDFAVSTVLTAPSPATTGTSIVLQSGDGANMPAVPFYATLTQPGQLTTLATSEKVLVTARPGNADTFTIVRAQTPTTAKSIAAGWIFANAMYTDDVMSSSQTVNETLTGTINGTNTVFTTAQNFTSIRVYKNGVRMNPGASNDYTVTGQNQITFNTAPATGTILVADYIVGSQVMVNGSNSIVTHEAPAGTIDGTNKLFTLARGYVPGSLQVYVNGMRQSLTAGHYTETSPSAGTFTLSDAPLAGDVLGVSYQFVTSVSGNADTVDGYHASNTATAGQLIVLDSNGKQLPGTIYQWAVDQKFGNGTGTRSSKASGAAAAYTAPSITITNPYNKTVTMNFMFGVMAVSTTSGQNFQVYMTFDGTRVSSSLYYDYISPGIYNSFATPFSFTFAPNQSVTARIKMDGNGSGNITDTTTDDSTGWNPRLVGQIASIS